MKIGTKSGRVGVGIATAALMAAALPGVVAAQDGEPVAVCELKRYVADADLASGDPYIPQCKPATGRRVAIVGAGPTGLSAAYHLLQVENFNAGVDLCGRQRKLRLDRL